VSRKLGREHGTVSPALFKFRILEKAVRLYLRVRKMLAVLSSQLPSINDL